MEHDFKKWGQEGGRRRAKVLSRAKRQAIARGAIEARWKRSKTSSREPVSVRLDTAEWHDPVFLEEVLSFGGLREWSILRARISDKPFGDEAAALEAVLASTSIYGATPLWRGLLRKYRGACCE